MYIPMYLAGEADNGSLAFLPSLVTSWMAAESPVLSIPVLWIIFLCSLLNLAQNECRYAELWQEKVRNTKPDS